MGKSLSCSSLCSSSEDPSFSHQLPRITQSDSHSTRCCSFSSVSFGTVRIWQRRGKAQLDGVVSKGPGHLPVTSKPSVGNIVLRTHVWDSGNHVIRALPSLILLFTGPMRVRVQVWFAGGPVLPARPYLLKNTVWERQKSARVIFLPVGKNQDHRY